MTLVVYEPPSKGQTLKSSDWEIGLYTTNVFYLSKQQDRETYQLTKFYFFCYIGCEICENCIYVYSKKSDIIITSI